MRIVVLQPGYLPWLGFFDQMQRADRFIIYDDVQYTRRDWRSRNRIKSAIGAQWLTVPVINRGRFSQLINEAEIDYSQDWLRKHLGSIRASYQRAPYFADYYEPLATIMTSQPKLLLDLDLAIIQACNQWLGITTPIMLASELKVGGQSSERLFDICQKLAASHYLTGNSASDYLDVPMFTSAGIEVEYHHYQHPHYPQLYGEFIPYLSIIDLLFNCGRDSFKILVGQKLSESED